MPGTFTQIYFHNCSELPGDADFEAWLAALPRTGKAAPVAVRGSVYPQTPATESLIVAMSTRRSGSPAPPPASPTGSARTPRQHAHA